MEGREPEAGPHDTGPAEPRAACRAGENVWSVSPQAVWLQQQEQTENRPPLLGMNSSHTVSLAVYFEKQPSVIMFSPLPIIFLKEQVTKNWGVCYLAD